MAPKATLFIPAACAHCRKRIRLGHWALHPCTGCARVRSLAHPFRLHFGLSSTLARLRGGNTTQVKHWRCWAPYGAPEHRRTLAEYPKDCARDRAGRPPVQGCAVGRLSSQSRGCEGVVAPSGFAFLLVTFLWRGKEKLPAVGQPPTSYKRARRALDQRIKSAHPPATASSRNASCRADR